MTVTRLSRSVLIVTALLIVSGNGSAQKFYPDDPIWKDYDDLPIEKPGVIELSPTYDLLEHTFAYHPEGEIARAANPNTLGEVPNSSWFTNRIGVRAMSLKELVTGPTGGAPPATATTMTIIAAKQGGITPGFTLRDARSNIYFIKFDPRQHPNLSTGADVVSKNFLHAIGYNVPEAYIVYFLERDLTIDPSAMVTLPGGKKIPMDRDYLQYLLDNAARHPDGSIRAVASLLIQGEVIGPFKFHGTRPDDPNDIFPHEDRRELRGYRVFSAWLNHDDSRSINTLDSYVPSPRGEGGYVKHYLIDFGSTLGSGSDLNRNIAPQNPRAGNEYFLELEPMLKTAYTFGLWERPWMGVKYPYPTFAEIGRIEADFFEPESWKPEYPNPAFDRLLADDGFWAAKIIARFSDEAILAIVSTGDYLSIGAEHYLAETLSKRRDKIISFYFQQLNPLDQFSLESSSLSFRNLGEEHRLATVEGYEYEWFEFDNDTSTRIPLSSGNVVEPTVALPATDSEFIVLRLRTRSDVENWHKAVDVYLRRSPTGRIEVIGIEREI